MYTEYTFFLEINFRAEMLNDGTKEFRVLYMENENGIGSECLHRRCV